MHTFVLIHVLTVDNGDRFALVPADADPALLGKIRKRSILPGNPRNTHWNDDPYDDDENRRLQRALVECTVAELIPGARAYRRHDIPLLHANERIVELITLWMN